MPSHMCTCCQVPRPFDRFDRMRRQGVCSDCELHANGNTGMIFKRRDAEHKVLWLQFIAQQRGRIAGLSAELVEAQDELRDRPVRVIHENLDQEVVDKARQDRETAYRLRDSAFQALCEVRLVHRDNGNGRCRCGQRMDQCASAQIADRYPALPAWEEKQIERCRNHEDHWLPENHPVMLDRRLQVPQGRVTRSA